MPGMGEARSDVLRTGATPKKWNRCMNTSVSLAKPASVRDQPIVCLASNYFFDPTSKHHVMRELSKTRHVLWINWHASRKPALNGRDFGAILEKLKQIGRGIVKVDERLWVMTPLVVPLPGSKFVRTLNRWLVGLQTRWVLRKLPGRPQLWSFAPDITNLHGAFGEDFCVYYCVDEFSAFPGYDLETIRGLDRQMCESADLVVTSSRSLYEGKRRFNPQTVEVPHGVLHQHFARALEPDFPEADDLRELPRPRIGFYGLIHEWQDLDLIARLAELRPQWSFVFVGKAQTDVQRFATIRNLHFLGRRSHDDLPHYSKGFDVAVIPHKVNELTRNMNPIKLREYLAAGLPVVSSPLPEVQRYEPEVRIAEGVDGWLTALERSIADRNPEVDRRRSQRVAGEDWSVRVAAILEALKNVEGSRVPAVRKARTAPATETVPAA